MQSLTAKYVRGLLLVLILGTTAHSQSKYGTTAGQFLGIAVGPRAIAMGGAYVASNDDATSLYWNPGAFQQAGKSQFIFSNTDWLVGTKFRWFGFMLNLGDENALGLSLTQLDYGDEAVTTVTQPDGNGQRWSAQDLAFAASYCRRLTDRFSLGGSLKYVQQQIWNESAGTFAFDLGLLFVTGFNDMRLGVTMSNFGGDLKLEGSDLLNRVDIDPTDAGSNKALVADLKTDPWSLPLLFRVGVAMDVVKTDMVKVTLAGDALRPSDNTQSVNVGGEVGWNNMAFFRGGYNSIFSSQNEAGLSLGGGLRYDAQGLGILEVNYAYTDFGLFGSINTIGLGISF
ncbi:MAG TPA: PorV/PorQ family protein [Bacteroidota bacterium]|nr:PorV/PorQ family protein [Bacteroidota bacterium]